MTRLERAMALARTAHEGQTRKWSDNAPYLTHPVRVAMMALLHQPPREDMVLAALLHDTLEDCEVTLEDIKVAVGPEVAKLVLELTNPSKQFPHLPRAQRKAMDLEYLKQVSQEAKILKLMDRLDNLNEAYNAPDDWLETYLEESINLIQAIGGADVFIDQQIRDVIAEHSDRLGGLCAT